MSELWKLNIEDYNLNELKQLFELKDPHTLEDVVMAHQKVKDYISVDTSIGEKKRKEISSFLDKARDVLMKRRKKPYASKCNANFYRRPTGYQKRF